jgi:hypothetical protein
MKWGAVGVAAVVIGAALAVWLRVPLPPPTVTGSRAITNDGMQKLGMVTDGSRIYFGETTSKQYPSHKYQSGRGDRSTCRSRTRS